MSAEEYPRDKYVWADGDIEIVDDEADIPEEVPVEDAQK